MWGETNKQKKMNENMKSKQAFSLLFISITRSHVPKIHFLVALMILIPTDPQARTESFEAPPCK